LCGIWISWTFIGTKYWSKQTLPVAANVDVKFRPELQEVSAGTFKAKASFVVSATTNDTKDKVFGLEFEMFGAHGYPYIQVLNTNFLDDATKRNKAFNGQRCQQSAEACRPSGVCN
jgi:ubiquitin C-terminal hydrolase